MCSIIGSFSKQKFKELVKLNQSRGSFSYSFLQFDTTAMSVKSLEQNFGEFPLEIVDKAEEGMFFFGHCQAPTGGLINDPNRIHPVQNKNEFLFHNGIIKQKDVTRLREEHSTIEGWDTKLMLLEIQKRGLIETLNTIDGSFACAYKNNNSIFIFRSQAGTLFVDAALNISSTKFDGAERINHDTIFELNLLTTSINICGKFKSKSSPYFY